MKIVYTNEMDKRDIKVDEEQLKTQFDQLAAQYGSEEALIADIESKGFTFDEIKDEFRYQFRLQELNKLATEAEREVTEEEIQQFYNDNKETIFVIQPQVTASHILFNVDDVNPNLALEKAKQVRAEIIAGKDFAEAAKEYSQGPTGPNGGYLGTFGLGQMVKEFEMVAFAIPENEVSEPVLTQFGYHLILVESRTDKSYAPYEETKSYISQKIKVDGFFKDIENSVKITKPDWLTL